MSSNNVHTEIKYSPPAVRRINVEMDVVKLELRDSKRDALLIHRRGLSAELDVHVGNQVGERVGLEHNRKREVVSRADLLGVRLDELLLVDFEAVLAAVELAGRLAGGAVTVGKVVEDLIARLSAPYTRRYGGNSAYQADYVVLSRLLLEGARILNGGVNVDQVLAGRDPDKGADVLDGASTSRVLLVSSGLKRGDCFVELVGPARVGVEFATVEGRGNDRGGFLRLFGCLGLLRGFSLFRNLWGIRDFGWFRDLWGISDFGGFGDLGAVSDGRGVVLPAGEAGVGRDDTGGREGREDSSNTHRD